MEPGPRAPPPGGGREDCWSEGETAALVDAWGERYLQLNRGNLRHKDWGEVADAVNARDDAEGRPRRTDVQCKNRIDTLKKKYKAEKSRAGPSSWPFFSQLDLLVGPTSAPAPKKPPPPYAAFVKSHSPPPPTTTKPDPRPSLPSSVKHRNPNLCSNRAFNSRGGRNSPESSESSSGGCSEGHYYVGLKREDGVKESDRNGFFDAAALLKRRRTWGGSGGRRGGCSGVDGAFGELARAIGKLGEIYERVENSKQQQIMELERQRMEFAKEIEFQRMQMFMEVQLDIEKMKRPKYASGSGKRS